MFAIEKLWENKLLVPLKRVYDTDPNDRRLVVVADDGSSDGVNMLETESLHKWLEMQKYQSIPSEWETGDLYVLPVIHISNLTVASCVEILL